MGSGDDDKGDDDDGMDTENELRWIPPRADPPDYLIEEAKRRLREKAERERAGDDDDGMDTIAEA
jgi:hypothetical protein